jgi:hypothetical protein
MGNRQNDRLATKHNSRNLQKKLRLMHQHRLLILIGCGGWICTQDPVSNTDK